MQRFSYVLGTHPISLGPTGIIIAESGFAPARALLDHRRSRFAQHLIARPHEGQGPEEILDRIATIAAGLKGAAGIKSGGTVESQEWSEARRFPGRVVVEEREPALRTAKEWRRLDTVWTDGSGQENGAVGAACVWRTQEGWAGRHYHLGSNNKVFDAEVLAIYRALSTIKQRQERGR